MLCAYPLAMVRLTRLSRLRRCRLFPRLCVLRPDGGASASPEEVPLGCGAQKDQSTPATTKLPDSQSVGYSLSANFLTAVGAVGKSPAEAVLATAQRVA